MKDKKIQIIFSNYDDINNPYYGGGGAIAIHEVAKRLVKKFDVKIITGNYPHAKNRNIDNVEYIRIGTQKGGPKIGQLVFQALLPYYVFKLNFDVWIENFTPPFSTALLPLLTHKPIIGLTHLLGGKDMSRKYLIPFQLIESFGLRQYHYFIALTETVNARIKKINDTAVIAHIPNGTYINKSSKKRDEKHILFIGRIDIRQKGLDILIRSFAKIANKVSHNLIIAGNGTKKDISQLQELIKEYNLAERVLYKGFVKGKKKEQLYRGSVCMVLPSTYETLPITLFEAFNYGCPVITFAISDLDWLSTKYCVKVPPFDENMFAKKLVNLLQNETLRNKLSIDVQKYVKQFHWDKIADQYTNFIFSII